MYPVAYSQTRVSERLNKQKAISKTSPFNVFANFFRNFENVFIILRAKSSYFYLTAVHYTLIKKILQVFYCFFPFNFLYMLYTLKEIFHLGILL